MLQHYAPVQVQRHQRNKHGAKSLGHFAENKRLKVQTFLHRRLQGKPEQQQFTMRSGVLASISSRQRSAIKRAGPECGSTAVQKLLASSVDGSFWPNACGVPLPCESTSRIDAGTFTDRWGRFHFVSYSDFVFPLKRVYILTLL